MKTSVLVMSFALLSYLPFASAREATHWSYTGEDGPEHWGELSPEFAQCSVGRNQSPIDLVGDMKVDLPELSFDYKPGQMREVNNGHSIVQFAPPGSYLRMRDSGERWQLVQFHFHSPSEHTVAGQSYPLEAHLVHQNDAGDLAVVGALFIEGEEHPLVEQVRANLPEKDGEASVGIYFEPVGLLAPSREYFTYNGSLTTPPCSEGVAWIVLKTPIEASADQIAWYREVMGLVTNRPIQPHNSRIVLE